VEVAHSGQGFVEYFNAGCMNAVVIGEENFHGDNMKGGNLNCKNGWLHQTVALFILCA
jgi:hypothetical protein